MRLLLAEDERSLSRAVTVLLRKNNYEVDPVYDGEEALDYLGSGNYDGAILDIMMPKRDGIDVLRQLRQRGSRLPVLLLTAKSEVDDKVLGLDSGANDYLTKPFASQELLARIRAMTRKHAGSRSNIFTLADLTVDTRRQRVERGGREISLLPKEFAILEHLIRNKGAVISREQLEDRIWNYEYSGSSNNVDVYMSRLRKKLDEGYEVKLIHTVRGSGWVLREDKA